MHRTRVMVVDDNIANLKSAKSVLIDKYDVFTAPSAVKMFELLKDNIPALILLDIEMPGMDGYEALQKLKSMAEFKDIPVVFLTARDDAGSEIKGLGCGAVDYLSKPLRPELLKKRVELHIAMENQKNQLAKQAEDLRAFNVDLNKMVKEKTERVLKLQGVILKAMANMVESRDDVTGGHIERVMRAIEILIAGLEDAGVYTEDLKKLDKKLLVQSSQLHDVGKIAISDAILCKPAKLTEEEFEVMKTHAALGADIIDKIAALAGEHKFFSYAKELAGSHHEKWDGTGYPAGLAGERIPFVGRLLAIVDVYDALVSVRPYKKALSQEEALKVIENGKGVHFDPVIVDIFLKNADALKNMPSAGEGSIFSVDMKCCRCEENPRRGGS